MPFHQFAILGEHVCYLFTLRNPVFYILLGCAIGHLFIFLRKILFYQQLRKYQATKQKSTSLFLFYSSENV